MNNKPVFIEKLWSIFIQKHIPKTNNKLLGLKIQEACFVNLNKNSITFEAPTHEILKYIQNHKLCDKFFEKIGAVPKKIKYTIKKERPDLMNSNLKPVTKTTKTHTKVVLSVENNLVVGDFNRRVIKIVEAILSGEKKWNPLFIYSASGLGKTSILQLIINCSEQGTVFYTAGLEFVSLVFEKLNLSGSEIEKWKTSLKKYQIYLFDDVHFFANKTKTNEVLLYVFNDALAKNKTIIFTSETHPENFIGFEKHLKSRFQKGVALEIKKPKINNSIKITEQKFAFFCPEIEVEQNVVELIAKNFAHDIRCIEGIVKKITFQWSLENYKDSKLTLKILKTFFNNQKWLKSEKLSVEQIRKIVSKYYGVNSQDLIGKSGKRRVTTIRHIAIYLAYNFIHTSFQSLANDFGLKSHGATFSAVKKLRRKPTDWVKQDLKKLSKLCEEAKNGLK